MHRQCGHSVGERVMAFRIKQIDVTECKIRGFTRLVDGWHYGEGVPPNSVALERAISFNRQTHTLGFHDTDAFPGFNGEVMFTVYADDHYLEFVFEPDGSVTFCHEINDKEVLYEDNLGYCGLASVFDRLGGGKVGVDSTAFQRRN